MPSSRMRLPNEVDVDDGIAVLHRPHRLPVPVDDDEARDVLVDQAGSGGPEVVDGGLHAGKAAIAVAMHMQLPTLLHLVPVVVAIHGNGLAPATGGEAIVPSRLGIDGGEGLFQPRHIDLCRLDADIATVQQRVHAQPGDAQMVRMRDQCQDMVDMGMHIAVGEQAEQVQGTTALQTVVGHRAERLGAEEGAVGDGLADAGRPLVEDQARPHRQMPDLGAAEIGGRGQADKGAVRQQAGMRVFAPQAVEIRRVRPGNGILRPAGAHAPAIHDDEQHRAAVVKMGLQAIHGHHVHRILRSARILAETPPGYTAGIASGDQCGTKVKASAWISCMAAPARNILLCSWRTISGSPHR